MFELSGKEYYSGEDVRANAALKSYLEKRNLLEAATKLATDNSLHETFKTNALLEKYLIDKYSDEVKESGAKEESKKKILAQITNSNSSSSSSSFAGSQSTKYKKVHSWGHAFTDHGSNMKGDKAIARTKNKGLEGACGVWLDEGSAQFIILIFF